MGATHKIIVLANSKKNGGRCIAGKSLSSTPYFSWVRPVADRGNNSIMRNEYTYESGGEPRLLDVAEISLIGPCGEPPQTENWILNNSVKWKKAMELNLDLLPIFTDPDASLWIDGFSSSGGFNDRVPEKLIGSVQSSLRLIAVNDLRIQFFGDKARGFFNYLGENYGLVVTDPVQINHLRSMGSGEYAVGDVFLTISLGEYYQGYRYKLIAAIIAQSGGQRGVATS
jgi:hypothetical protein